MARRLAAESSSRYPEFDEPASQRVDDLATSVDGVGLEQSRLQELIEGGDGLCEWMDAELPDEVFGPRP